MNNDQSPQPQKQSFWAKLFGGNKKQDTTGAPPFSSTNIDAAQSAQPVPPPAPINDEPITAPPAEPAMPTPMPDPTVDLPPTEASPSMEKDFSIPASEDVVTPTTTPNDVNSSPYMTPSNPDINVNVTDDQPQSSTNESGKNTIPQPPTDPMVSPVVDPAQASPSLTSDNNVSDAPSDPVAPNNP